MIYEYGKYNTLVFAPEQGDLCKMMIQSFLSQP